MATLRDLGSQPFVVVPAGELPVTAPADQWAVLVGAAGPVSALAPGTSLASDGQPPGILVAPADLGQAEAFDSDAFQQLTEVSALVLTEPAAPEAGPPAVAGVVTGLELTRAFLRGAVRRLTDSGLPGAPSVALISRSCGYVAGPVSCATPMQFQRRPFTMPPCPNDRGLTAHLFGW